MFLGKPRLAQQMILDMVGLHIRNPKMMRAVDVVIRISVFLTCTIPPPTPDLLSQLQTTLYNNCSGFEKTLLMRHFKCNGKCQR